MYTFNNENIRKIVSEYIRDEELFDYQLELVVE